MSAESNNGAFNPNKSEVMSPQDGTDSEPQSSGTEPEEKVLRSDLTSMISALRQGPSPAAALQSLKDAVRDYDPLSILAQLTVRFLFALRTEFHEESSEVHLHHGYIEFLTGLLVSQPFPRGELSKLDPAQGSEILHLVDEYFNAIKRDTFAEALETPGSIHELETNARNHSMTVRGEAYPHQLKEMALGLYGEHDAWFRHNLGFTIRDAFDLVDAITALTAWRHEQVLSAIEEADKDRADKRELLVGYAEDILGFTAADLQRASGGSEETCSSLLKRLSQEFGYRNEKHPTTFSDPKQAPWDFNTLYEKPLIHHAGRYFLFVPPLVRTALFKTFWFDLHADAMYRETWKAAQGRWLERAVADKLRGVFGGDAVILNPRKDHKKGDELSDVLVLYDRNILVVQCKSKGLQHDSRVGLDVESILSDVRKAVVEAFEQGIGARSYLMGSEGPVIYFEGGSRRILRSAITSIFLLTVTTLPLQFLTTRLANNQSVRDLFSGNEYPWALSLPDLDTLTEVLQAPEHFLHYARRRVQVERTPYSLLGDEMDLLGLYLSGHLSADSTEFEGFNGVMISGLSGGVDEYIWRKHELGENVEPPTPSTSADFARLIKNLRATGSFGATDCALTLLDQSGRQHQQLLEGIAEAKRRFLANGKMQRFSAIVAGGDVGVSFLIMDASDDPENLGRQLEAYAMVQKYAERCPKWVAMAADGASSQMVDLCMFLSGPWEEDKVLEELADKHIPIRAKKTPPAAGRA